MKKRVFLAIGVIACVLLFTVYFIIISLPGNSSDGNGNDDKTDDAYLYVDQNTLSEISAFSFIGDKYRLSFAKDESGIWKYTENRTLPVDAVFLEERLEALRLILATKQITSAAKTSDLEQYGLDEPSYTLTLQTKKGAKTYLFGDFLKSRGLYYMTEKGSHSVYLVENTYVENFALEVFDFLSTDSLEMPLPSDIRSVLFSCGDYEKTYLPDGEKESDTSRLISALCSITLTDCVDFGRDVFDIYGLADGDLISAELRHKDGAIRLHFGLGETEEFIYLLVQNGSGELSEMVYLFKSSDFSHLYSQLSAVRGSRDN